MRDAVAFLQNKAEDERGAGNSELSQDLDKCAGEIERLRAALKPFADFADPRKKVPAVVIITNGSPLARPQLRMQDCYAAADALQQTGTEKS